MLKKKAMVFTVTGLVSMALSGCLPQKAEKAASAPVKKDIAYAAPAEMRDINVHLYAGDMAVQGMVFEPLVENTPDGIKPALAESWDISPDGAEYVFHLRKGVKFHDGEPFNAEAVKLNFDAIIKNKTRHNWMNFPNIIKNYEVLDESTFKLVLAEAYYPALAELGLTRPFRFMSPKTFINGETKDGVAGYAGTGPYILREYVPNQYAVLEANPEHWRGKPAIEKLTRKVLPIGLTALLALEKGEIDVLFTNQGANMFDADALSELKARGKYQIVQSNPVTTKMLIANTSNSNSPIADDQVRLALWYAIDRNLIARDMTNNMDIPANTLFSPSVPYCDVPLEERPYSLEKAVSLLENAGWKMNGDYRSKDGKSLEITINFTLSKAGEKAVCEYLQSQCQKIGLKLNIEGVERVTARRAEPDFELVYDYTWGAPYDPQSTLTAMHAAGSYLIATSGLKNIQSILNAVDSALVEFNEDKRQALWADALAGLHGAAVFIPLTYGSLTFVAPAYLDNIGFNQSQYEIPFDRLTYK